jgi:tetratricopeptide (TPR) repeat protein
MHFVLGIDAERRGEEDIALDAYEAAIDVDPSFWRALFHCGKIALKFGFPAEAVDYFNQVAEINPAHAPTRTFLDRLAEANIDVGEWQSGVQKGGNSKSEAGGPAVRREDHE